jgi:hypothetical protein
VEVEDSREATDNKATTKTATASKVPVGKTMASSRATVNSRAIPNSNSTHKALATADLNSPAMITVNNPTANSRVVLMEPLHPTQAVIKVSLGPMENEDSVLLLLEAVQLAGLPTRLEVAS